MPIPSPFLRVEHGTTWEEGNYIHRICNFAKIDHESEENFQRVRGGQGGPEILILGNDIISLSCPGDDWV